MADGLTTTTTVATIPSGSKIVTDDCGAAGHAQGVKLCYDADGVATFVTADANGLEVQLGTAIPAGTNAIGKLAANSGVDIGDVDVTSVVPGTTATALGKAEDAAHSSGDTGVMALAVRHDTLAALAGTDLDYTPLQVDSSGALYATLSTAPQVVGLKAHDAADDEATNFPLKLGAKATTSLVGLTAVATADMTDVFAGADGVLITRPHCNLEDSISGVLANTDGASTVFTGLFAATASQRIYITGATVANSHASTFCTVDIRDGAAGSVLYTVPAPASGGGTFTFSPPLRLTANTAAAMDVSAAVSTVTLSLTGFKSKI